MYRWKQLLRWFSPLAAGLAMALVLGLLFWIDLKTPRGGLGGLIALGLNSPGGIRFGISLVLRELIPLYVVISLVVWILFWLSRTLVTGKVWWSTWGWREGFGCSLAGIIFVHFVYWLEVPTTLWVLPGLRSMPIWAALLLIIMASLFFIVASIIRGNEDGKKFYYYVFLSYFLWIGVALLPIKISKVDYNPSLVAKKNASNHPKLLMLAIDGLRYDVSQDSGLKSMIGEKYINVYTPIPATRLLYHMLWGGDVDYYSVGHVVPSLEEYLGRSSIRFEGSFGKKINFDGQKNDEIMPLRLLEKAKARNWKVRFCIDDGGTIGLSGRSGDFDSIHMPASGWENFVNSNLAVHFPLYAVWIDVFRIFPSTTPWSDPSNAINKALNVGATADWTMLHSCAAHQPIFLTRNELKNFSGWWRIQARDYEPVGSWRALTQRDVDEWKKERNPALAYKIRISNILKIYTNIWNDLGRDPNYKNAIKIFFSDHGERFYHVTENIQLQGTHGFNLDPWEMRVPLVIQWPENLKITDKNDNYNAVSLLELRDYIWELLKDVNVVNYRKFGEKNVAFGRYHTISPEDVRPSQWKFRQQSKEKIINATYILPNGLWVMKYDKNIQERDKDVTVAQAEGAFLTVYKPLDGGGALKSVYENYTLLNEIKISEDEFIKNKEKIDGEICRSPWR